MSTTVTDRVILAEREHRVLAVIDLDAPAKQFPYVPSQEEVREPEFVDNLTQTAVWIGPDAAVEVGTDVDVVDLYRRSGFLARTGAHPSDFGIATHPHNPGYTHPAKLGPAYSAWRVFTDAIEGA